jgi:hypothetical protein
MDYASRVAVSLPLGGGVTEAACEVNLEQQRCASGMKREGPGEAAGLSLRCPSRTPERWS